MLLSLLGTKVAGNESSNYGTVAAGNESSIIQAAMGNLWT